jgi:hypothetical protein
MMNQTEETVKIYTLEKEDEVLLPLIKEAFKKEEIPLQIRSKYDTAYDGIFIGQKGLADLYVFKKDEQRAVDLLAEIKESHQSEDFE